MATRLKQILTVTALAGGATVVLAHALNWNGRAVVPDYAEPSIADTYGDLAITAATTTTVTVENMGLAAVTATILIESWHTIERDFGAAQTVALTPQPFVPARAGASSTSGVTAQRYTAAGGETDFMVTLTNPKLVDTYKITATCAGVSMIVGVDCPDLLAGDRTTTQFRVITSAPLTAGDQIDFVIV